MRSFEYLYGKHHQLHSFVEYVMYDHPAVYVLYYIKLILMNYLRIYEENYGMTFFMTCMHSMIINYDRIYKSTIINQRLKLKVRI